MVERKKSQYRLRHLVNSMIFNLLEQIHGYDHYLTLAEFIVHTNALILNPGFRIVTLGHSGTCHGKRNRLEI